MHFDNKTLFVIAVIFVLTSPASGRYRRPDSVDTSRKSLESLSVQELSNLYQELLERHDGESDEHRRTVDSGLLNGKTPVRDVVLVKTRDNDSDIPEKENKPLASEKNMARRENAGVNDVLEAALNNAMDNLSDVVDENTYDKSDEPPHHFVVIKRLSHAEKGDWAQRKLRRVKLMIELKKFCSRRLNMCYLVPLKDLSNLQSVLKKYISTEGSFESMLNVATGSILDENGYTENVEPDHQYGVIERINNKNYDLSNNRRRAFLKSLSKLCTTRLSMCVIHEIPEIENPAESQKQSPTHTGNIEETSEKSITASTPISSYGTTDVENIKGEGADDTEVADALSEIGKSPTGVSEKLVETSHKSRNLVSTSSYNAPKTENENDVSAHNNQEFRNSVTEKGDWPTVKMGKDNPGKIPDVDTDITIQPVDYKYGKKVWSKPVYQYGIIKRTNATRNDPAQLLDRRNRLIKHLKAMCMDDLTMCDITPFNNTQQVSVSTMHTPVQQSSSHGATRDKTGQKQPKNGQKNSLAELLELITLDAAIQGRKKSSSNSKDETFESTTHKPKPTSRSITVRYALQRQEEPTFDSAVTPANNSYYADKAVWIGIGVGSGMSWLMMMLLYGCYRCLLHYKSERQNKQLQKLANRKAAYDSNMHIQMARTSNDKNGNHYVVSILNDKEEDEWSSEEEEVFNVSATKGFSPKPKTSTPVGTPIKKKPS